MIALFGALVAGLGLFVFGVKQIQAGLQRQAGRRVRQFLLGAVAGASRAAASGAGLGAVTQSSTAAAYIAVSLTTAGMLPYRSALRLTAWAVVGPSIAIFLATVSIEAVVLYLVGIGGFLIAGEAGQSRRWGAAVQVAFGLGILLLGLHIVREGASVLAAMPLGAGFARLEGLEAGLFLIAVALAALVRSSSTVAAIGAAVAASGLIPFAGQTALVAGACLGAAISTAALARQLSGTGRRVLLFQALTKLIAAALLLTLIAAERTFPLPLLETAATALAAGLPALQTAIVYCLTQVAAALAATLFLEPLGRLAARFAPFGRADAIARPQYLYDQALDDPMTAADLAEKEQARLFAHLPAQLDAVRSDGDDSGESTDTLAHGHTILAGAVERFLTDILARRLDGDTVGRAVTLRSRNEIARGQIQTLSEFAAIVKRARRTAALAPFAETLTEVLHLLLTTLGEASAAPDREGLAMLEALTGDRSEVLEQARRSLLRDNHDLSADAQDDLFQLTTLFERSVWLVRRLLVLLRPEDGAPRDA